MENKIETELWSSIELFNVEHQDNGPCNGQRDMPSNQLYVHNIGW